MSRSQAEHGIYVGNSGDRPVIRRNVVWGNNANGIHMNGDLSQGGDGIISGAIVEGNIIHDNGSRRRLRHQLRRRSELHHPQQPPLQQPRQRHLALSDRRRSARAQQPGPQQHDRDASDARWVLKHPERQHLGTSSATTSSSTSSHSAAASRSLPTACPASSAIPTSSWIAFRQTAATRG